MTSFRCDYSKVLTDLDEYVIKFLTKFVDVQKMRNCVPEGIETINTRD